ncbi:MAG: cytochrome c3 family protein [Nitrospirota bacterium]|jgi:nitrate/TMAO reductase-like tetraheme cytochrome c subunit
MRYLAIALLGVLAFASLSYGGYREAFEKEFLTMPWAGGVQVEESSCIACHTSDGMKEEYKDIPEQWRMSWHYQNDVSCHDCHGGDEKDASLAMSHKRGFVGVPTNTEVPDFCGKCHIRILKLYRKSGHGEVLARTGNGPNCVTCHGSHNIQKASINIINEQRCTQCHSYERAKQMKQALFLVENQLVSMENDLVRLKASGALPEEMGKSFFNTQAEFRTLFHAIDVDLIKDRTDEFTDRLAEIEVKKRGIFEELEFRKKLTSTLMILFLGMGVVLILLSRPRE